MDAPAPCAGEGPRVLRFTLEALQAVRFVRAAFFTFAFRKRGLGMGEKLKLYGFNNLTKALSFNIYDVCYAKTPREQRDYIAYIDEQYNSERLTNILTTLTDMIGAKVLNIARQDYDPQGASVTILIAEGSMVPAGETQLAHLDKSHVTVHTYPEYHPETCLATFRVDIDVATCGEITPLSTLDYLIGSFDSDIITMDYRVRGFTRDLDGKKLFLDHEIASIQNYIDPDTLRRYDAVDINVYEANLFHTKMMVKDIDLQKLSVQHRRVRAAAPGAAGDHAEPAAGDDRDLQRAEHLLARGECLCPFAGYFVSGGNFDAFTRTRPHLRGAARV